MTRIVATHCYNDTIDLAWSLLGVISEAQDFNDRFSSWCSGDGKTFQAGSYVRSSDGIGKIMFCAEDRCNDDIVVVAHACELVRRTEAGYSLVRSTGLAKVMEPQRLQLADAWRTFEGDCILILLGAHRPRKRSTNRIA